jgi:hypothetical protein
MQLTPAQLLEAYHAALDACKEYQAIIARMTPVVEAARKLHWSFDEDGAIETVGNPDDVSAFLVELMRYDERVKK